MDSLNPLSSSNFTIIDDFYNEISGGNVYNSATSKQLFSQKFSILNE